MDSKLEQLRRELREIDSRIVSAIAERSQHILKLAEHKSSHQIPIRDFDVEAATIAWCRELAARRGLNPDSLEAVFRQLISDALRAQAQRK
jgi:chorismate mutase